MSEIVKYPLRHSRFRTPVIVLASVLFLFTGDTAGSREGVKYGPMVWQDPVNALAIGGYDPVAYYTQKKLVRGRPLHEIVWGGAAWQFANSGNKDAFKRHPEVYAPAFAGYDVYALTQGNTTRGDPSIWARYRDRIYLFNSAANLKLWSEQREQLQKEAEKQWKTLSRNLPSSLGY